jgi:hypothetical protein
LLLRQNNQCGVEFILILYSLIDIFSESINLVPGDVDYGKMNIHNKAWKSDGSDPLLLHILGTPFVYIFCEILSHWQIIICDEKRRYSQRQSAKCPL